jgi:hypothetical protein
VFIDDTLVDFDVLGMAHLVAFVSMHVLHLWKGGFVILVMPST